MVWEILASVAAGMAFGFWRQGKEALLKWLNVYLLWIGLPLLMLVGFVGSSANIDGFFFYAGILSVANVLVLYALIHFLSHSPSRRAALLFVGAFPNTAYLGIPVLFSFMGEEGIHYATLFTFVQMIIHYTLGMYLATSYQKNSRASFATLVRFPLLWGILVVILLSFFIREIPAPIVLISRSTVYLAPFVVGLSFRYSRVLSDFLKGALLKFVLYPLIFFVGTLALPFSPGEARGILMLAFLPPAMTNTIIARAYGFDEEFTATFTTLTTVLYLLFLGVLSYI